MNKAAAVRSQARRAALVKRAGVLDRLAGVGARYKELLAGNSPLMGTYRWGKQAVNALSSLEDGVSPAAERLMYMWGVLKSNSPLGSELRKIYATRAGTGVAGIAGLKALLGGSGEKKVAKKAEAGDFTAARRNTMRKMAAVRSQARRAALTKAAEATFARGFRKAAEIADVDHVALCKQAAPGLTEQLIATLDPDYVGRGSATYLKLVDPANVGAAAGIAGGAGLLGDALLPGENKSKKRRIASGVAGAGLLGGGAYLAANDTARNAVRRAVLSTLGRVVEPFRKKMAEDRGASRRALLKAAADHSFGNRVSEWAGFLANPEILATLGGALTLPAGGVGIIPAAVAGGVGRVVGPLLALIKKQRSRADQQAYDSSSHVLKNLLLPGAGSYNMFKRLGHADA